MMKRWEKEKVLIVFRMMRCGVRNRDAQQRYSSYCIWSYLISIFDEHDGFSRWWFDCIWWCWWVCIIWYCSTLWIRLSLPTTKWSRRCHLLHFVGPRDLDPPVSNDAWNLSFETIMMVERRRITAGSLLLLLLGVWIAVAAGHKRGCNSAKRSRTKRSSCYGRWPNVLA